jgi:AcrR family transcriptional regulator
VSLRQVAGEAGVSPGMVQHYFRTKEEMLAFALAQVTRDLEVRYRKGVADSPRSFLRRLMEQLLPLDEDRDRDAKVSLVFAAYSAVRLDLNGGMGESTVLARKMLTEMIAADQRAGVARSAVEPEYAAVACLAAVDGLAMHVLTGGCTVELARAAFEAQLDAVLGPE